MVVSAAVVKELREKTGIGMMDCKRALEEAAGDLEKAVDVLRKKGMAAADKRAGRAAGEGFVGSYIHSNGKIGVIVEINCETDFVARSEEFRTLARDIAMQVAATNPMAVSVEDIGPDVVEKERAIYAEQAKNKPANIIDRIVDGKMKKFYQENCLVEQQFVKDADSTVAELIKEFSGKVGERVIVRRFARFAVGETL
ncbi:MAG: translation elongation factor Ts [Planctomycetes bacterium]|nr:translation elongation factor Ts [Planctomycetota bacterium]